ncbi:MAG: GNAT family N-acetyltransferase [Rhodococcus sp. (in: high G+C Gram-positive bacteria)]
MDDRPVLETVQSDDLSDADAHDCECLVRGAFGDRFEPHDWTHALGGVHLIVRDDGHPVGHAAVVPRLLSHEGKEFDGAYVEGVALDHAHRGHGLGAMLMDAVEKEISSTDALGVLNSLPDTVEFYADRGWVRWRGLLGDMGNLEDPAPPDDEVEAIMVFRPSENIDVDGTLCVNNRVGPRW